MKSASASASARISILRAIALILVLLPWAPPLISADIMPAASHDLNLLAFAKFQFFKTCLLEAGVHEDQLVARDDLNTNANADNGSRYAELNFQWNTLYGQLTPMGYLLAENATDVAVTVRCCTGSGVRIVARSGGHSYLKYGFGDADSLVVDLQRMNQVEMDASTMTATIGAGARGGRVQYKLWAAGGFILPTGLCPTVGIAGYTLGGGYGYYSRLLGLASDNVLEATMVDWTGAVRTVNNDTDPDLYWALRGGGGGSFGIVTSFKFRIGAAPTHVIWASVCYELEQFPLFFTAWQAFITGDRLPDHLGTFLSIGGHGVCMMFYSMGGTRAEVDHVLRTKFPSPSAVTVTHFTYPEFMLARAQSYSPQPLTEPSQLANLSRHNAVGWKKVKSIFVDRVLERDEDIDKLHRLLQDYTQYSSMGVEHYGGAIDTLRPTDTAFSHRGRVLYDVQLFVYSADDGNPPDAAEAALDAMERFFEASKGVLGHTRSYQNYLDEDMPDYLRRYYQHSLERLVAVKRRVDPHNVFHNPRSIPTSL